MQLPFHTLDVFTDTPFAGNPLAVVRDAQALDASQMQAIAREFNLSETVFVLPPNDAANTVAIRIFMPDGELPFAGHPTIGTAILLASLNQTADDAANLTIRLEEGIGVVPITVERSDAGWSATLAYAEMPSPAGTAPPENLVAAALGLDEAEIGLGKQQPGAFEAGVSYLFVPVRDLESLARARVIEPHWSRMTAVCGIGNAYVYTTGEAEDGTDIRARLFEPATGIVEDPATGSAAAALPGQLFASAGLSDREHHWTIGQGYEMGRPSRIELSATVTGGQITAVTVGGQAVIMSSGHISV